MNEAEVIRIIRQHLEKQFPKVCPNCQRSYGTLREYVRLTTPQGAPIPYDVQRGEWLPVKPLGTVVLANCPCGSTLALSSEGVALTRLWQLWRWARAETVKRGQTPEELLAYLREKIREQVLAEAGLGGES